MRYGYLYYTCFSMCTFTVYAYIYGNYFYANHQLIKRFDIERNMCGINMAINVAINGRRM
jgi:hypothetical protein